MPYLYHMEEIYRISDDGKEITFLNEKGEIHRAGDKPAVIHFKENPSGFHKDGKAIPDYDVLTRFVACDLYYHKNGKRHRDGDEPAAIYSDGTKAYYKNGKHHRDGDEPAVIWAPK